MSLRLKAGLICRKIFLALLLLIIVTVVSVTAILFTHSGTNFAIKLATKFEPRLAITLDSGSLFLAPHYSDISWESDALAISFSKLEYAFDWSCAFTKICVKKLHADDMVINLNSDAATKEVAEEVSGEPFTSLQLPITIDIQSVILNNSSFIMPGIVSVSSKRWEIQAQGFKDNITIINSKTDGLLVTLPNSEEQPAVTQDTTNFIAENSFPAFINEQNLSAISTFFNLDIKALEVMDFKLTHPGQAPIFAFNSAQTKLKFFYNKLNIEQLNIDLPDADLALIAEADLSKNYPLKAKLSGKLKDSKYLQPAFLLNGQEFILKSSGNFSDLKTELKLSNKIDAQINLEVNLFADNLPYRFSADWKNLRWPLDGDANQSYFFPQGRLSSKGKLNDYQLSLQGDYAISAVPKGKIDLNAQGDLQKLRLDKLKVDTLDGFLQLTGVLDWKNNISWQGELAINGIDLKQLETEYTGQFNGKLKQHVEIKLNENSPLNWQVSMSEMAIDGKFLERPFAINGDIKGNDKDGLTLNNVFLHNADNKIRINGKLQQQNDLTLDLDIKDLSHAVIGAAGKINGQVKVKGPMDAIDITSDLQAGSLSYEQSSLNSLSINGQFHIAKQPKAKVVLRAEKLSVADQLFDTIDVNVKNTGRTSNGENHQINAKVVSELVSGDLEVKLKQVGDKWLTAVNAAALNLYEQTLTLNSPFDINIKGENIQVTTHCWTSSNKAIKNSGKLCLQELNMGNKNNLIFNIDSYLLASFDSMLPDDMRLSGAVSADANIKWGGTTKPVADIKIYSTNTTIKLNLAESGQGIVEYPVEKFFINLATNQKETVFSADLFSKNLLDAKVKGQLKPYLEAPGIQTTIDIDAPDFEVFNVLIPELEKFSGMLTAQMTIEGAVKNPNVNGQITITDVQIRPVGAPMQIHDLNTIVKINNNSATLKGYFDTDESAPSAKGKVKKTNLFDKTLGLVDRSVKFVTSPLQKIKKQDIDKGKAYITGEFDWQNKFKGSMNLQANKLVINDYSKLYLLISPNLELTFDDTVSLTGDVYVDQGKIVVKELPPGSVSTSKDVIIVDREVKTQASELPMKMSVKVDLGRKLEIEALGLDTTIKGNLLVRKRVARDLTIHGDLEFENGSYRALGQQLVLQNSRVVFQGLPDSPYISIEAIRDPDKIEDDVTAGVRVTGTPDQLELVVFSDPSMSQQDALSYLTRGKSIASTSTSSQEDNQLAGMLIDFGAGRTEGIMEGIGNKVGISDFTLSSSGSGDTQALGVSGYIAPNLELSYGVGVFDSFTVFAIRYELFENFYIEASNGLEQAIDAYYEWDSE
ncbi:translocation/assembly module TamB domain-containing protein [Psychromonas sp.]|uniref:translocation/assembly module TamB domain-containing protein n=1 Tax=Psychromonas sp. TaxID=1884585 RepID=UPI00356A6A4B